MMPAGVILTQRKVSHIIVNGMNTFYIPVKGQGSWFYWPLYSTQIGMVEIALLIFIRWYDTMLLLAAIPNLTVNCLLFHFPSVYG